MMKNLGRPNAHDKAMLVFKKHGGTLRTSDALKAMNLGTEF